MPDIEQPVEGALTDDQSSTEAAASAGATEGDELETLRKRQSGADKARDIAIRERDEALALIESLRSGKPAKAGEKGDIDIDALKQELRKEFSEQTASAVKAERMKGLARVYPNATKRFPNLDDEAQLAELEEVFGDKPKPVGNNAARSSAPKKDEDMTAAELAASIKAMDTSNLW
jgi:hypothetical protein